MSNPLLLAAAEEGIRRARLGRGDAQALAYWEGEIAKLEAGAEKPEHFGAPPPVSPAELVALSGGKIPASDAAVLDADTRAQVGSRFRSKRLTT